MEIRKRGKLASHVQGSLWCYNGEKRETWWWNESVLEIIQMKKIAFKQCQQSGDAEDREYRRKRRVSEGKRDAWTSWSEDLNSGEGRNNFSGCFTIEEEERYPGY